MLRWNKREIYQINVDFKCLAWLVNILYFYRCLIFRISLMFVACTSIDTKSVPLFEHRSTWCVIPWNKINRQLHSPERRFPKSRLHLLNWRSASNPSPMMMSKFEMENNWKIPFLSFPSCLALPLTQHTLYRIQQQVNWIFFSPPFSRPCDRKATWTEEAAGGKRERDWQEILCFTE